MLSDAFSYQCFLDHFWDIFFLQLHNFCCSFLFTLIKIVHPPIMSSLPRLLHVTYFGLSLLALLFFVTASSSFFFISSPPCLRSNHHLPSLIHFSASIMISQLPVITLPVFPASSHYSSLSHLFPLPANRCHQRSGVKTPLAGHGRRSWAPLSTVCSCWHSVSQYSWSHWRGKSQGEGLFVLWQGSCLKNTGIHSIYSFIKVCSFFKCWAWEIIYFSACMSCVKWICIFSFVSQVPSLIISPGLFFCESLS